MDNGGLFVTAVMPKNPLGTIFVAVTDIGLAAVQIGGEQGDFNRSLAARFGLHLTHSEAQAMPIIHQIETYLQGKLKSYNFPIHWGIMSPFQQKSLQTVCQIPYGETRTYGQIADQIGAPRAARAVGRANATNPMPLVIPCHRLVGADGSLRGYGSGEGIKTKAWLLNLEKNNRG